MEHEMVQIHHDQEYDHEHDGSNKEGPEDGNEIDLRGHDDVDDVDEANGDVPVTALSSAPRSLANVIKSYTGAGVLGLPYGMLVLVIAHNATCIDGFGFDCSILVVRLRYWRSGFYIDWNSCSALYCMSLQQR
jgi:hypothetical protein